MCLLIQIPSPTCPPVFTSVLTKARRSGRIALRLLMKRAKNGHTLTLLLREKKRHFVLNRADSKVGISISDVESAVGMEVDVRIPSSRLVPRSMNEGTPLIESAPKSPVARAFDEIADLFSPRDESGAATRSKRWRQ